MTDGHGKSSTAPLFQSGSIIISWRELKLVEVDRFVTSDFIKIGKNQTNVINSIEDKPG